MHYVLLMVRFWVGERMGGPIDLPILFQDSKPRPENSLFPDLAPTRTSPPESGEYTLQELLDYTGDGIVTVTDVVVLIQYLASGYHYTIGDFDASTLPCYAKVSTNDACISSTEPVRPSDCDSRAFRCVHIS